MEELNLPANRFELELEFVQALASPAYIHFLATNRNMEDDSGETSHTTFLQDPAFLEFLKYLQRTWSQPEYARFLSYPHCLFFLDILIEKHELLSREWALPNFRNFNHNQQFLSWQHRHATCYGRGASDVPDTNVAATDMETPANDNEGSNK